LCGFLQTGFRRLAAIERLAAHPERIAETAALMTRTWPAHYGPGGGGDAARDLKARIADDRGAIALMNGIVVGTVALASTSFGAQTDEGPWLIGLCTDPQHRGKGIANALVQWAMRESETVFSTTQTAAGVFTRLDWKELRQISDNTGTWTVWRYGPA